MIVGIKERRTTRRRIGSSCTQNRQELRLEAMLSRRCSSWNFMVVDKGRPCRFNNFGNLNQFDDLMAVHNAIPFRLGTVHRLIEHLIDSIQVSSVAVSCDTFRSCLKSLYTLLPIVPDAAIGVHAIYKEARHVRHRVSSHGALASPRHRQYRFPGPQRRRWCRSTLEIQTRNFFFLMKWLASRSRVCRFPI